MDGSEKDFISRPHCVSSAKVKLREGKDKSGNNKIKKLRQRISASFGRLTISKEETIPENDFEFEPGSFQSRSLGGDRMAHSFSLSPSPLVCQSLNGTPDRKSKGGNNQRGHPSLLQCLGHSLDESGGKKERGYQVEIGAHGDGAKSARIYSPGLGITPVPPHSSIFSCLPNSQKSHHHSSLKRAFSMLTSSSSATSVGNQQQHSHHHHFSFFQKGGSKQNSEEDGATAVAASGGSSIGSKTRLKTENQPTFSNPENLEKPSSKFHLHHHQKLQHNSVQRHHSTGDMLVASFSPERGSSGDVPKNPAVHHAARSGVDQSNGTSEGVGVTRNGVKLRHHRPRSEGSFTGDGMRNKRASSFGSNSPFGKVCVYEKLEQLGEGSYATVYKGISLLTGKVVALKEIRLQPEEGTPFTAIREASLLKGLKHANIVTLHDIVHTKESLTFVFEFVHTDLGQYLEKHPGGINPKNVKIFMFQLLRGLLFCHNRQILHRDLKPQNLLISEIGELKLADFGLARAKSVPSRTYSNEVVTLWYRPPDVLLGSTDYSTSLDIWGVGCIFTEMITGAATFPGMKDSFDQLTHIWQVFGTPNECNWEGVTNFPNYSLEKFGSHPPRKLIKSVPKLSSIPYAEHLAESLLQLQPNKRIDAYNALHHKYFYDIPNKLYNLPDVVSIFDLPCIRLAPELNDLLGMRSNNSAPSVALATNSSTAYVSSANQKSGTQQLEKYPIPNPPGVSILKISQTSESNKAEAVLPPANNMNASSCKASSVHVFGPSLSFKGPSAV